MIVVHLKHTNYREVLASISEQLHLHLTEDVLHMPPDIADGYFRVVELPNGLQALLSDLHYHVDITFKREKSEEYFCILHFNDAELSDSLHFLYNGKQIFDKGTRRAGVTLSSSANDMSFTVKGNTKAKSLNILLPGRWINDNLNRYNELQVLSRYNAMRNTLVHPEPFDAQNRILFDEVFQTGEANPLHSMIVKNRIMLLLEHFLSKIYRKMQEEPTQPPRKIKASDMGKLMEIESLLVRDFGQPPPTIALLAEKSGMSVSKLKSAFKRVYGTGIYEYYQKNRMQKAKSMLLTGQYNVKEVGTQLGYSNLSNFSLAFKKEFKMLPSQV
ncbi:MAG TPA: helix-turn-helix transcriptional regulator [Lacibacter sp.]|jgi:AraC-like DNA-binding protein|nr:helix-turn-helix transcriptional regulator [Lacibacter sp.]